MRSLPLLAVLRALAITLGLVLLAAPASAAACPQTSVADLEDEVMCVVCGTQLGLATEAPQAQQERAFIQRRVDRCESKPQIKAALVAEFGQGVLALPERGGFGLAAYLIPALALIAGMIAVAAGALRWRHRRASVAGGAGAAPPDLDAEDSARLDADMERYEL